MRTWRGRSGFGIIGLALDGRRSAGGSVAQRGRIGRVWVIAEECRVGDVSELFADVAGILGREIVVTEVIEIHEQLLKNFCGQSSL